MTIRTDENLQAKRNFGKSFNVLHNFFFFLLKVRHAIFFFFNLRRPIEMAKMSFLVSYVIQKKKKKIKIGIYT